MKIPHSLALAIAALTVPHFTRAEEPLPIRWAVQAGGAKHDKTRAIAVDARGNIYLTGEFSAQATFGEFTLSSRGELDFFVAKLSPEGKFLWVRTGGGSKTDRGYGVAVDATGNVFATGHCQGDDASFGAVQMPNRGDYDAFVVCYDAAGQLVWLRHGGGAGYDYGHSVALDAQGHVFVTGSLVGAGEFAGAPVTNEKGAHAFLAKFSGTGNLEWLRASSGPGGNAGEHVAVDGGGNAVIAGGTSGASQFGDVALTVKSGRVPYLAKFDPAGQPLWAFTAPAGTSGGFASVAVDGHGEISACGMFQGTLEIGGKKLESAGAHDTVFARFAADGKLRWQRSGGGAGTDYALGIKTDTQGHCFVVGEFTKEATLAGRMVSGNGTRDSYVAKFDATGALHWIQTAGGTRGTLAYCLAPTPDGGLCVSGAFDGEATYGATKLTSFGNNDILLLKLAR